MNNEKIIYAGIVLFNPEVARLKKNIYAVQNQVDFIVLVDNGSSNIDDIIELFQDNPNIFFICNKNNKGIAYALNQIIDFGEKKSYEWCVTLDQDSCITENMISTILQFAKEPNVAMICPVYYDINKEGALEDRTTPLTEIHIATDVITSGSCVKISAVKKIGGFDEKLFIDCVDTDLNERLMRDGYRILRANEAKLIHEIGHYTTHHFLFWKVACSNHSAFRRYYITRNRLYYERKYFGYFSYLKEICKCILVMFKCLIYEDDGVNKIKSTLKGMHDFHYLWKQG